MIRSGNRQKVSLLLALFLAPATAHAIRTVALSGAPVPGELAGVQYTGFGEFATFDPRGKTAFLAHVAGPRVATGQEMGIWSEASGFLTRIVRAGDPVPGRPQQTFTELITPLLSADGTIAFPAANDALGFAQLEPWFSVDGSLTTPIKFGDTPPGGGPGQEFNGSSDISLTSSMSFAFQGFLDGPGVGLGENRILFGSDPDGGLRVVARGGEAAPGTPDGVEFSSLFDPVVNRHGAAAFQGTLCCDGINNDNLLGLWSEGDGALRLVARTGSPAPGTPAPAVFDSFFNRSETINSAGHVAFVGFATYVDLSLGEVSGIWSDRTGELEAIATEFDDAPGVSDATFLGFRSMALNRDSRVAFDGFVEGVDVNSDNSRGVWSEGFGELRLVAREGDAPPGVDGDAEFRFFENVSINRWGQTAFQARLRGDLTDPAANGNGIWAQRLDGEVVLIVREGADLELAPGDVRTVSTIDFVGGAALEDGRRSGFNDRGQVLFRAEFTDGSSGVFVSDAAVALPGDFNADGVVDAADFAAYRGGLGGIHSPADYGLWAANRGAAIAPATPGDANGDGAVNAADYAVLREAFGAIPQAEYGLWASNLGAGAATSSAVPEPGGAVGFAVLIVGGLLGLRRPPLSLGFPG